MMINYHEKSKPFSKSFYGYVVSNRPLLTFFSTTFFNAQVQRQDGPSLEKGPSEPAPPPSRLWRHLTIVAITGIVLSPPKTHMFCDFFCEEYIIYYRDIFCGN